jgi:hypothetical protein
LLEKAQSNELTPQSTSARAPLDSGDLAATTISVLRRLLPSGAFP